jgi:hypothetical protein
MAFLRHTEQCLLPFPPSVIYFTNLSFLVPEIFTFFEKHVQNLNTHAWKLGELGLTVWI